MHWAVALILLVCILAAPYTALYAARYARRYRSEVVGAGPRAGPRASGVGVLYHGSPATVKVLEPRPSSVIDGERAVFATNRRWLALVCGTPSSSKDLDFGYAGLPYIAEVRPGAFDLLRKPCNLYTVSADGFHSDARLGMPEYEFIRKGDTVVIETEHVPDIYAELQRFTSIQFISADNTPAFYRKHNIPPS